MAVALMLSAVGCADLLQTGSQRRAAQADAAPNDAAPDAQVQAQTATPTATAAPPTATATQPPAATATPTQATTRATPAAGSPTATATPMGQDCPPGQVPTGKGCAALTATPVPARPTQAPTQPPAATPQRPAITQAQPKPCLMSADAENQLGVPPTAIIQIGTERCAWEWNAKFVGNHTVTCNLEWACTFTKVEAGPQGNPVVTQLGHGQRVQNIAMTVRWIPAYEGVEDDPVGNHDWCRLTKQEDDHGHRPNESHPFPVSFERVHPDDPTCTQVGTIDSVGAYGNLQASRFQTGAAGSSSGGRTTGTAAGASTTQTQACNEIVAVLVKTLRDAGLNVSITCDAAPAAPAQAGTAPSAPVTGGSTVMCSTLDPATDLGGQWRYEPQSRYWKLVGTHTLTGKVPWVVHTPGHPGFGNNLGIGQSETTFVATAYHEGCTHG